MREEKIYVEKEGFVVPDKAWYKSSTMWGAVALGAYAVFRLVNGNPIDFETVALIAGAFGLTGIRRVLGDLKLG